MSSTPQVDVLPPGSEVLVNQATSLVQQGQAVAVKDKKSYLNAAEIVKAGKCYLDQVGETFDPLIETAHKAHKQLIASKKKFTAPVEDIVSTIKRRMGDYDQAQERARQVEERRLQEEARKFQEQQAVSEAAELEKRGDAAGASAVIEEALSAPPPVVVVHRDTPRVDGVSQRSVWKWEIVDVTKIPAHLLIPCKNASSGLIQDISTSGITAQVKAFKAQAEKQVPGIRVWEERITVVK